MWIGLDLRVVRQSPQCWVDDHTGGELASSEESREHQRHEAQHVHGYVPMASEAEASARYQASTVVVGGPSSLLASVGSPRSPSRASSRMIAGWGRACRP